MKTARSALFCLLTLTAPAWISAPSGAPWAVGVAHAQDQVTKMARERFIDGVKAYDAGRYDEARTLFLQAYALKRHPAVLLNLGQSELKAGHVEAGGNHLQQFLREHSAATEDQKKAAREGIAEAQKRTGFVILIVDADGAEIAIDGQTVGKAPLLDPHFVEAGPHKATASLRGKSETVEFVAKRGTAVPVTVNLGVAGVQPSGPTPSPDPTPAPTPDPGAAGYPPSGPSPIGPGGPPMGPGMPPDTGPDRGRTDFLDWYVERPVAWVLTGVAGVGLGLTVGFGIAAGVANSNAGGIEDQINAEISTNDSPSDPGFVPAGSTPCGDRDRPQDDQPHYSDACNKLRENLDAYDTDIIGVGVSAAITGAAAIALVVYYFVDSDSSSTASSAPPLLIAPVISPTERGVGVAGAF